VTKKYFIAISAILVIIFAISFGYFYPRDRNLEALFSKELVTFKKSDKSSLDLRSLLGTSWKKVCMQSPYQLKDDFEKRVGEKVHGFEATYDDVNTLWIFYNDGTLKWLQIKRIAVMDYDYYSSCTSIEHPLIYSHWRSQGIWGKTKNFYFLNKYITQ
jgi:hypothetical protein